MPDLSAAAESAPLSVMLVDDEPGILATLGPLVADMGYQVVTAQSGEAALQLAHDSRPPHVLLTDVRMPVMDGMALLRAFKTVWPDTEVLMLTGHGDMQLAVESLRQGAGDFLTKPVNADVLEFALARAAERIALRGQVRRYTSQLESLVEQRTRELLEAERLAAMGETAGTMAHAIKNLAGGLEGAMFVLEKGLELDNREYLEQGWQMLRKDVGRLRDMAMNLLHLSRPAQPDMQPGDPLGVARDVVRLLQSRAADAGALLRLEPSHQSENAKKSGSALFDYSALHACLMNLVINAVDAVEEAVAAGTLEHGAGTVSIRVVQDNVCVRWIVCDNGSGLPAEAAGQLRNGRFTSKPAGSGFGLMATRKSMREQNGELHIRARARGGTEAELSLPLSGKACHE
jgi:FixJ family two-component response regulator